MDNNTRRFIALMIFSFLGLMYFGLKELGISYYIFFILSPAIGILLIWFSNKKSKND